MLKLLIADDEEDTRKGIRNIISWEENGIQICGEAENGKEALEMVERFSPDILLIDIRMPIMDGLQVIEALNRNGSATESIILSGYDDFSYAQKALKLGTSDYLLKPCRPKEILETVLRVKDRLAEERLKAERMERIRHQFQESLPLLKEQYLTRLVQGVMHDDLEIDKGLSLYQIHIKMSSVCVAVIRIDNFASLQSQRSDSDIELTKFAVRQISDQLLNDKLNCEVFGLSGDIVAIANVDTDNIAYPLLLSNVKDEIGANLGITVSIGIGNRYDSMSNARQSFEEALSTLEFLFLLGANSIMVYSDIQDYTFSKVRYPLDEEKELQACIASGKTGDLAAKLANFLGALGENDKPKEYYIKSSLALLFSIYHTCVENGIDTDDIFGHDFSTIDNITRIDKLSALEAEMLKILELTSRKYTSNKGRNSYVEFMLKYIDDNLSKDISLESIASEAYITPGYVSLLFKQTIGINFVDYLQRVRIKKACELIKDVRIKIYEVSSQVGFNDEKYFSQIFKKSMGMTPSQYRDMIARNNEK